MGEALDLDKVIEEEMGRRQQAEHGRNGNHREAAI